MSRNSVLVLMVCLALFGAWRHFHSNSQSASDSMKIAASSARSTEGTVVVYGRDNCTYTQKALAALQSNNVPVTYINIDYVDANDAFHEKFDGTALAGDRGYALPVVEVAGRASMRPDPGTVIRQFRSSQ